MSALAALHVITDAHIHTDCLDAPPALDFAEPWGGYRALVPGVTPDATRAALAAFADDPRYRFAAARHPWYLEDLEPDRAAIDDLAELLTRPGVVAVGESGLDRRRFRDDPEGEARSERWFRAHVALAVEFDRPLIIHCVRRHGAVVDILREHHGPRLTGMVHAFTGSIEVARTYRRLGFHLGIGPVVTRPDARRLRETVAALDDGDYTLETDAPFMATGERTPGEGYASDLLDVLSVVAELRGTSERAIATSSAEVWTALFGRDG